MRALTHLAFVVIGFFLGYVSVSPKIEYRTLPPVDMNLSTSYEPFQIESSPITTILIVLEAEVAATSPQTDYVASPESYDFGSDVSYTFSDMMCKDAIVLPGKLLCKDEDIASLASQLSQITGAVHMKQSILFRASTSYSPY